jgi:DNA-binding transcriptional LysR family regulator
MMQLMDAIYRFMDLHPKLKVEVISTSEVMDIVKHNVDVAFVIEPAIEALEHFVLRPIFQTELRFYASPDYLARKGIPATLSEIEQHNVILFRVSNGRVFNEIVVGENERVKVRGNFCTNNLDVVAESVLRGRGIAYLPSEVTAEYVANGSLVALFPETSAHQGECYLAYPSRRFVSLASRRFIDFIMENLAPQGVPTRMITQRKSTFIGVGNPFVNDKQ